MEPAPDFLPRQLSYRVGDEERSVASGELIGFGGSLVLLGEAGMGKTVLTEWLGGQDGYRRCTAKQLIRHANPAALLGNARVLVIDALDEVPAQRDGDAIDLVLNALGRLGHPPFVLSCRIADWRSATGLEAIREDYGQAPIDLQLQPFDSDQARAFLAGRLGDADRAAAVVAHFEARGLDDLLGNPQTLIMIEAVAAHGDLPGRTSELFDAFVAIAWSEHSARQPDAGLGSLGRDAVLDALGAAFAALILGGKSMVSRLPVHQLSTDDLPLAEVATLPGAGHLGTALRSRLAGGTSDRRTYQHRRIGEYLGARWLAGQARTPRQRRRLLAMFQTNGIVPASLRGLHAWLAWHSAEVAGPVIDADPMGVIEYGEGDALSSGQGERLLQALVRHAERNPWFRNWRHYRAASLLQPALLPEARRMLRSRVVPFALRWLLVEQVEGANATTALAEDLRAVLLDREVEFAIRREAGRLLGRHAPLPDWPKVLQDLHDEVSDNALRLATELLEDVGFDRLGDQQMVEIILARAGLTLCAVPKSEEDGSVARFHGFAKHLPSDRIETVLDAIVVYTEALLPEYAGYDQFDLIDLITTLVLRQLALGPVDPVKLWTWLRACEGARGYHRDNRDELGEWLTAHDETRRAIQRHVLVDDVGDDGAAFPRLWRMIDRVPGLRFSEADTVALLAALDPHDRHDERWRDVVRMVRHDGEAGRAVRDAARPFAAHRSDLLAWLDGLATPTIPEWQVKQDRKKLEAADKRELARREHRAHYQAHREQLRRGEFGFILSPAQAYLGQFRDTREDAAPPERVIEWLGDELAVDAFAGFEAFLRQAEPHPTATEMAASFADSRHWNAGAILVAAFAERLRRGDGFDDLPDERLIAAKLELEHGPLRKEELQPLDAALDAALRARGAYEALARLLVEPYLEQRHTAITGLYSLMRESTDAALASTLAVEWLARYPDMPAEPEELLIDRLSASRRLDTLAATAADRLAVEPVDERRRRNWQAVQLLTDFAVAGAGFAGIGGRDRDMLWALRARYGDGFRAEAKVPVPLPLMAWVVREFRQSHPYIGRRSGSSTGDTNPWDGAEYLLRLINRLGEDVSDEAIALLQGLAEPRDGYDEAIRNALAEQATKRAEQDHRSPSLADIRAAVADDTPVSVADLQQVVLAELDRVQAMIVSDPADTWTGFYLNPARLLPKHEEDCSDYLVNLLRQNEYGIEFSPEDHLGGDRETDLGCRLGQLWLPCEAKGQWHDDLWTAADRQLGGQQAIDHRADGHGIYIVYWFGACGKALKAPPGGLPKPATASELEQALRARIPAARAGLIAVKVLDCSRPPR